MEKLKLLALLELDGYSELESCRRWGDEELAGGNLWLYTNIYTYIKNIIMIMGGGYKIGFIIMCYSSCEYSRPCGASWALFMEGMHVPKQASAHG